jgi:hypothetical protein
MHSEVNFTVGRISILCPTRSRPANVEKLVESARNTASDPESLEFLFYVDFDDSSFPSIDNVRVVQGPRVWISNAQNVLYSLATGEILMTAGDDMEFLTPGWDDLIRETFESIPDRIALVFGNDLATHSGKIAVHGFFHRRWVDVLGTWVQPGRGSLWDLWSSDVAKKLDRFIYIENLLIKHVHYRQGAKEAAFDATYQYVYSSNSAFDPMKTYKLLERERRIDAILLSEQMVTGLPLDVDYLFSTLSHHLFKQKLTLIKSRKLLTITNKEFLLIPFRKVIFKMARKS